MPALRVLRNIVDRMKNLSNFVRVSANNAGELKFCVETDLVTVSTYFHDLDRPMWRQYDSMFCVPGKMWSSVNVENAVSFPSVNFAAALQLNSFVL